MGSEPLGLGTRRCIFTGGVLSMVGGRGGVKQKIDTVEIDDSKGYREQR